MIKYSQAAPRRRALVETDNNKTLVGFYQVESCKLELTGSLSPVRPVAEHGEAPSGATHRQRRRMKGQEGCIMGCRRSVGANRNEETGAERIDGSPRGAECGRREAPRPGPLLAKQRGHLLEQASPGKTTQRAVTNVSPLHMFLWDNSCCSG